MGLVSCRCTGLFAVNQGLRPGVSFNAVAALTFLIISSLTLCVSESRGAMECAPGVGALACARPSTSLHQTLPDLPTPVPTQPPLLPSTPVGA